MSSELDAPAQAGFIPLCVPEIRGNEWLYVKACLDSGWVSSVGGFVDRFEGAMADRMGVKRAVATVNGTAALHVALRVAGVEAGDEVVVSTLTFIAPANAVRYLGAWPVFMDAEPRYWQLDVAKLTSFLRQGCDRGAGGLRNRATGRKVKALLPVHILGHPVDMDPLMALAGEFQLPVIEDATEALGAAYHGKPVGSHGDLACFSFNGNKIITTGGGGMIITNDEVLANKAKYLTTQAKDDPVEYRHEQIGYNYRLTNMAAAVGVAQMEMLDQYVAAKRRIAARYAQALGDLPGLTCMAEADWADRNAWMFTVRVDLETFGVGSRALLQHLHTFGIQSRPLWQPLHRSGSQAGAMAWQVTIADQLHAECLSLPCSVGLTESQQDRVITCVRSAASWLAHA
jgi:perosamine synthetase